MNNVRNLTYNEHDINVLYANKTTPKSYDRIIALAYLQSVLGFALKATARQTNDTVLHHVDLSL